MSNKCKYYNKNISFPNFREVNIRSNNPKIEPPTPIKITNKNIFEVKKKKFKKIKIVRISIEITTPIPDPNKNKIDKIKIIITKFLKLNLFRVTLNSYRKLNFKSIIFFSKEIK